jgi:hypothetical protein
MGFNMKKTLMVALGLALGLVLSGIGGAVAASQITAPGLGTGAANHRVIKNNAVHQSDMTDNVRRLVNKDNDTTLKGAIYRVEKYNNGGGGSATVACADDEATSQQYTAIAGGVEGSTVASQSNTGFAVSSSFPGRMDWNTGQPKPDRLDGWIILGNGQYTSTLRVWVLCVPNVDIPVQVIPLDN